MDAKRSIVSWPKGNAENVLDDFTRLEQKIAKLKQRDRARGDTRTLRGSPERLLDAILGEIDETILPRRVSFSVDGGETLHLAVGNRRLQALVSPAPKVKGADAVADVELKAAEDEAVGQLKSIIEAVIGNGEALTVTTARFKDYTPASDVGVPVDQLSKAWGLAGAASSDAAEGGGVEGFIKSLAGRAVGWLRIDGEEVAGQDGEEDVIADLVEGAAVFLDGYFSKKPELEDRPGAPLGLVFLAASGASVVFVDAGDSMVFVRAEPNEIFGIARDWQLMSAL